MSDLPRATSPTVGRLLVRVRDDMVARFGISIAEAEGRIASTVGSWDLCSPDVEFFLGHEEADHWARWIYFGHDALWRARPGEPDTPRPWP